VLLARSTRCADRRLSALAGNGGSSLVTIERSREVLSGLKEAGVNLVASVPDINLVENKYRFIRHIEQTEGTTILQMPLGHSQERQI
jgi:hypothetical protein